MKKTMADLQAAIEAAQEKQKEAKAEIKKLEKDMADFKNNKEGKIDELKVRPCILIVYPDANIAFSLQKEVAKQKAELQKHNVLVKAQQKEVQTASIEFG